MYIKNIENKIKITAIVAIASVIGSVIISGLSFYYAHKGIKAERDKIYVLDAGVPLLVNRVDEDVNRHVEYHSHINQFHNLFFTIPPDDKYIEKNIERSLYLIDETGVLEYNNLKERGFYSQILSSNAVFTIQTDSINIDYSNNSFHYYGKQRIDRSTKVVFRNIVTQGKYEDAPRTENNPHGVSIKEWHIIDNQDIKEQDKKIF